MGEGEWSQMEAQRLIATRWSLLSRLKNWDDQQSWQEFYEIYWKLIYDVAIKSGLTDAEAKDAVQEVLLSVAKKIPDIKRDPALGSFKGWLLNATRWRITDQFRKRAPASAAEVPRSEGTNGTATEERIPDPGGLELERVWEEEWEKTLLAAAIERVKQKVAPLEYQIFDLCVVRHCEVKNVARKLKLKLWKVYFAQKRVTSLLQREVKRLEKEML